MRPGLMLKVLLMYFSTLSARRSESFWLCAWLAVLSVWPEISPLALGKYTRKSPTVFSSSWYRGLMSDLSVSKLIASTAGLLQNLLAAAAAAGGSGAGAGGGGSTTVTRTVLVADPPAPEHSRL